MKLHLHRKLLAAPILVVGLVLLFGGFAAGRALVGAQATEDEVHLCVADKDGGLRLVASTQACKTKESRLVINRTGPTGPQGEIGPVGPVGPPGPAAEVDTLLACFSGLPDTSVGACFIDRETP